MKTTSTAVLPFLSAFLIVACGSSPENTKAEKGDAGQKGADGQVIVLNKRCSKITSGLIFEYRFTEFATGDIFVTCSISDLLAEYEHSAMYRSNQNGAATGGCSLTYDVDTGSGGFWSFQNGVPGAIATYMDSVSTSNGQSVIFAGSDCSA